MDCDVESLFCLFQYVDLAYCYNPEWLSCSCLALRLAFNTYLDKFSVYYGRGRWSVAKKWSSWCFLRRFLFPREPPRRNCGGVFTMFSLVVVDAFKYCLNRCRSWHSGVHLCRTLLCFTSASPIFFDSLPAGVILKILFSEQIAVWQAMSFIQFR